MDAAVVCAGDTEGRGTENRNHGALFCVACKRGAGASVEDSDVLTLADLCVGRDGLVECVVEDVGGGEEGGILGGVVGGGDADLLVELLRLQTDSVLFDGDAGWVAGSVVCCDFSLVCFAF